MSVHVTRILQIGDIHYPGWPTEREGRDLGQILHARSMVDQLGYFRIERVLNSIVQTIAKDKPDAICLVGDITTKGDQKALARAAAHFSALLRPAYGSTHTPQIVVVPGNHDIAKDDATDKGLLGKFKTLSRLFQSSNLPSLPLDKPTTLDLNGTSFLTRIYGINTCMGSWELSSLGPSVLNAIENIQRKLDEHAHGVPPKMPPAKATKGKAKTSVIKKRVSNFDDLHFDNYDAPFVHQATLSTLSDEIPALPPDCIAVVVGHHNILSQEVPRYAPFADLINGGALRRSLQRSKRPVIYLHGHIHTDPVEMIQDVENPESQIVSISAPELKLGYNLLEIYSAVGRRPLGVRLKRYRIAPNGNIAELPGIRAAFHQSSRQRRLSARTQKLLTYLEGERLIEFSKLADQKEVVAMGIGEAQAESEVLLLFWSNMIDIEHLEHGPTRWMLLAGDR